MAKRHYIEKKPAKREPGAFAPVRVFAAKSKRNGERVWAVPHVNTEIEMVRSEAAASHPPCARKAASDAKDKGPRGLRKCHVELVLEGNAVSLRFCHKLKGKGTVIPVSSPMEATELSRRYCACLAQRGAKARKTCAVEITSGKRTE
jgi:hypothetical protein